MIVFRLLMSAFLVLMVCSGAEAGLPKEDRPVWLIKLKFKKGAIPKPKDLRIFEKSGKYWYCSRFHAGVGMFRHGIIDAGKRLDYTKMSFEEQNGRYLMRDFLQGKLNRQFVYDREGYFTNQLAMPETGDKTEIYEQLRKVLGGDLILESSITKSEASKKNPAIYTSASDAIRSRKVTGYLVCSLEKKRLMSYYKARR